MKLIFVRHGLSTGNAEGRLQGHAEFDLAEEGRLQAQKLHDRFQSEAFEPTHIYSSPQRRAADTARIASRSWPLNINYWDDLKEHDVGIFSGLNWAEIVSKYPDVASSYGKSRNWDIVEGAETFQQRRDRARRVIETVLGSHDDSDALLVFTHGGFLQNMLTVLMGTDRTWGINVQNTAVFEFALDLEQWPANGPELHNTAFWRINRFNDTSHLL